MKSFLTTIVGAAILAAIVVWGMTLYRYIYNQALPDPMPPQAQIAHPIEQDATPCPHGDCKG